MRNLRPIGWPSREADFQIAIDKHLRRAARRPRQRQSSSKRQRHRRAIHPTLADIDLLTVFLALFGPRGTPDYHVEKSQPDGQSEYGALHSYPLSRTVEDSRPFMSII